jgi:hypothetical protein
MCVGSGIHSAINGKIRPGNVGGLRTGDERHQGGDLFNMPISVERCGGLLRYRPIARGGIQIRVDWTRLHVIDGDAPAPDLSTDGDRTIVIFSGLTPVERTVLLRSLRRALI